MDILNLKKTLVNICKWRMDLTLLQGDSAGIIKGTERTIYNRDNADTKPETNYMLCIIDFLGYTYFDWHSNIFGNLSYFKEFGN
ncbi:MAG TPA: hypothetical protein DDY17_07025 [Syntrophaceae bacterium]|jgi:hypothetical protein|nr:hypothetical protein [Syntrophaceae bacterium]